MQDTSTLYALTAEAWRRVEEALPHFKARFLLVDEGIPDENPRVVEVDARIFAILDIQPGEENSIGALARICPAARFARNLLTPIEFEDGSCVLRRIPEH